MDTRHPGGGSQAPLARSAGRPDSEAAWRLVILGVAGSAAPLALAVSGLASPVPALTAAVAVAAVTAALAISTRRRATGPPEAAAPAAAIDRGPFSAMLEQLADPILLIEGGPQEESSSRRLLFANAAARDLLRIQRPGGPLTTAIRAPEVLDAVDEALYNAKASGAVYELRGVQDRFWEAKALPLQASVPGGRPGTSLAVLWLRDETELRRGERTRADFLANASHELRTPLASLTGFIETLRGHAREDEAARDKFLALMQGQAHRMRGLIDDLMSLSRIELGEHIPPSGVVDLASVTPDVIDGLGPLAAERCVNVSPSLPAPGAALVVADRDQIVQVIQNLVENAIKYAGRGGRVTVHVESDLVLSAAATPTSRTTAHFSLLTPDHAQGRIYAAVRVRDSGPGIARSHLPRLTERFYRVEGQRIRERPGTGLGLAIVKHIVNRHRGGLLVESTLGEGAVFTAYFPMAPTPTPRRDAASGLTAERADRQTGPP